MPNSRPDPAELLARIQREEARAGGGDSVNGPARGKLKIFFGMAPGVGKTYAMLAAAQRMAAQGVDVVAGIVETHGRVETELMLLGLDILPRKRIEYSGTTLHEFDAEAAILRRPDILLVDELAHTNAPGFAGGSAGGGGGREKRWQDVRECLKAGVNVYTTLNVQHLESINDVVTQITGVPVRETVPDSIFDEADEIELVDLPTEVLHERLRAGKVYLGDNAARAVDPSDGFFRKGNLTALRELALRRTAAWVDSELRRYKQDRGIRAVWAAGERIVVAVSPSPMSGRLIRAAKRMSAGLHADLLAVYVETPRTVDLSAMDRDRLTQNMRLAESLGATTATLAGENAARELIAFARARNVGKIVVGKTERPRWRELLFGSFIDNLIRESGDIDVYVVRGDDSGSGARGRAGEAEQTQIGSGRGVGSSSRSWGSHVARFGVVRFGGALLIVAATSLLALAFYQPPDLSEEALILLGGIVVCAIWCGRGPATLASVLSVLAFNFFFTEPRFSLSVNDPTYLLTFGVMLAVGLIVGTLAARTREQARSAWDRERQTAALYALSRELAAAQGIRDVAAIAARHTHDLLRVDVVVALPVHGRSTSALDVLAFGGAPDWFDDAGGRERGVAQWALDHGKPAGLGTQKLPASAGRYVPLVGTSGKLGILGLRPVGGETSTEGVRDFDASSLMLIDALVSQIASALERVSLSESQQAAKLEAERERLRSALLSSVSHDLRTPLASITGAASTLEQAAGTNEANGCGTGNPASQGLHAGTRASLLRTIIDESSRLNDIIANLVFATRLESGTIALNREWTTLEEIVGVGLARHREDLASRAFRVHLPTDLPMVRVDNAMLPQVVHNLIENALRYTPPGTPISVSAWTADAQVMVKVSDEGPGLSDDEAAKVFQRFYRGRASKSSTAAGGTSPSSTGMGLGLTICEGIIRAHGGRIWAEPNTPRPPHGVAFMFSLHVDQPQPSIPSELAEQTHAEGGAS
ncbi:MAG: sensor histidine kinase KdpD [Phycisphaerales bacterium]|nr:sensor histidine kinase KdpD [Phycisphaerales bacterium]